MARRLILVCALVALGMALLAPAAAAWGGTVKNRPPQHRSSECSVINRLEDIYSTDPARVNRTVRDHVKRFYLAGNLAGYWAEVSTCADANLTAIVQFWILYYDPGFVF